MLSRLRAVVSFRRFAAFTTTLTLALVMLGVYTAATGSGLACSAQWPLCDGGLLPQTIPSFIEWFHRLVAMVTGWFILGTAAWAWRRPERRTRLAATMAVVLLPLQISIGAVTVTLSGLVPGGYAPPAQAAHFLTALTIFSALVLTTLYAYQGDGESVAFRRARRTLPVALVALGASVLVSRILPVVPYSPAAQAVFYGLSLVTFAATLAVTWWLGRTALSSLRSVTGGALTALFVAMLLGRDLVYYTAAVRTVNAALLLLAGVALAGAAVVVYRRGPTSGTRFDPLGSH